MTFFRITLGNALFVCFLEKGVEELGKDGRKEENRYISAQLFSVAGISRIIDVFFLSVLHLNIYGAGLEGNAVRFHCLDRRLRYLV